MKKTNILSFTIALLSCMFAMTFTSCDNDDDDAVVSTLKFDPTVASVEVDSILSVKISGGIAPYTVASNDSTVAIATAAADSSSLTITGMKAGTTQIVVVDKNNLMGKLQVIVKDSELNFDNKTLEINTGSQSTVTVSNGTAPYTVEVADESIATATVKDNEITVTGVKAGTTNITVTDNNKVSGTVSVTVK